MLDGMRTETQAAGVEVALRRRAEETGDRLRAAVDGLLTDLGGRGIRDQRGMQEALNLSQSAVSRLVLSARSGDSLASLSNSPGLEALKQVAKGAAKSGVDKACLAEVNLAIAELEHFLAAEVGDRNTLEAVLCDWVQESRGSFELRHKAAAFKSMSALRGVRADVIVNAAIVHPSADSRVYDCIGIDAMLGCRRLRPSGLLRLFGSHLAPPGSSYQVTTLAGGAIGSLRDEMVPGFSTVSAAQAESVEHGQYLETTVRDLPLGMGDFPGQDLVSARMYRGVQRAVRGEGPATSGVGGQAEPPAEVYVVDALLHDDVWPDAKPELRIYDTVVRGITHPDNPMRQGDRLDMLESVQFLGRGPHALRMAEFARYPELVATVCEQAGWDASRLRVFRCRVRYPIYGSQIGLAFPLTD
ncbi:hypothetical protein GCM10009107_21110 [Ideonella azotifigens]|uniref:Uncharacterized protein n=3 Tax=Ideonella azotifigens TaxID=513160 RepID=A0ABP3V8N0_9BURK